MDEEAEQHARETALSLLSLAAAMWAADSSRDTEQWRSVIRHEAVRVCNLRAFAQPQSPQQHGAGDDGMLLFSLFFVFLFCFFFLAGG